MIKNIFLLLVILSVLFPYDKVFAAKRNYRRSYKNRKYTKKRRYRKKRRKSRKKTAPKTQNKKNVEKPAKKPILPVIEHNEIKAALQNEPVEIKIKIKNPETVSLVILHYASYKLKDWQTKEMSQKDSGEYYAVIPADYILKDGTLYYIEVIDKKGDVITTFKSQKSPVHIKAYKVKRLGKQPKILKNEYKREKISLEEELAIFKMDEDITTASGKILNSKLAPGIVSVIPSSLILKTGAKSLIELLKYLPGFYVKMLPSGRYSVSIRGVGKDGNILVMINGNRINNPYDSSVIFDMSTNMIEKIEIIRGPGSSLYGTDAVVGVINIYTTQKDKSIRTFYGSYNNYSVASNYSIKRQEKAINISGGVESDDGANQYIEKDDSRDMSWGLTTGNKRFFSQRWKRNGYLSFNFKTKKSNSFIFLSEDKRGTWVGPYYTATKGSKYKTDKIIYDFSYDIIQKRKYNLKTYFQGNIFMIDNYLVTAPKGYYSTISEQYFDIGKITKENYQIMTITSKTDFNYELTKELGILIGGSYTYLKMLNYDLTRNYNILDETYHHNKFDLYGSTKLTQNKQSRSITELHLQADYSLKDFKGTLGIRTDYYSDFGLSLAPRLALIYNISDIVILKALYGRAFRAPTIKELYDNTDKSATGILGNKNLSPETVETSEISTQINFWKFKIRSNFFYNINNNIISAFDPDGSGSAGSYQNIGKTNDLGVELETKFHLNNYFNAFFNISWFQRKFTWNKKIWKKDENVPILDERRSLITDTPVRSYNFGFNFNYQKFRTFIGIRNVSRALNNNRMSIEEINPVYIPEYWSYDFNLSYSISKNFLIYFTGIDLGENHYASPSQQGDNVAVFGKKGMIQPKYRFRFGLTYKLDL